MKDSRSSLVLRELRSRSWLATLAMQLKRSPGLNFSKTTRPQRLPWSTITRVGETLSSAGIKLLYIDLTRETLASAARGLLDADMPVLLHTIIRKAGANHETISLGGFGAAGEGHWYSISLLGAICVGDLGDGVCHSLRVPPNR